MSIFTDLIEKFTGLDLDGSDSVNSNVTERHCSNCPSNCTIAGEICSLCEPYKRKLIDAVYHADHIEEFRAQYEVVGNAHSDTTTGTITCPRCGGPTGNHYICDYCGAQLADAPAASGKIRVAAASDIPNPIMDAQNIIFERYNAIVKKYSAPQKDAASGNFISNLFAELIGTENSGEEKSPLGAKMSEDEIKEAAALYKVGVGDYLTGLDNGKYLTLNAKKSADAQGHAAWSPAAAGMAGMAGIGMIAEGMSGGWSQKRTPRDIPQRPAQYREPKPERPSDRKPVPEQNNRAKPYNEDPHRPTQRRDNTPQQNTQPARSDHWKERDPGRRRSR